MKKKYYSKKASTLSEMVIDLQKWINKTYKVKRKPKKNETDIEKIKRLLDL